MAIAWRRLPLLISTPLSWEFPPLKRPSPSVYSQPSLLLPPARKETNKGACQSSCRPGASQRGLLGAPARRGVFRGHFFVVVRDPSQSFSTWLDRVLQKHSFLLSRTERELRTNQCGDVLHSRPGQVWGRPWLQKWGLCAWWEAGGGWGLVRGWPKAELS